MKWLLALSLSALLLGQTPIPNGAPPSHIFDGRIEEWRTLAPTFVLRSTNGGRKARVWVRQVPEGLLIAGEVSEDRPGKAPDFPVDESEMFHKDHVEIWLAPEHPPKLPQVGWENMEGSVTVDKRQDCIGIVKKHMPGYEASCDGWLADVAAHRALVARLFARQFALSPAVTMEAYAQPAWEHIAHDRMNLDSEWGPLHPQEMPSFKAVPFGGGYGFESIVPWEEMPPLTALDLKAMRLMVDVFSANKVVTKNQPFSTSSPARRYGDVSTMNLVTLVAGRKFHLTACEYPLEEWDAAREVAVPAFFRPTVADELVQAMILTNEYSHRGFAASGESPTLATVRHWQQALKLPPAGSTTITACGPQLAVRDIGGTHRLHVKGDREALEALAQPDGAYLVRSGPTVTGAFVKEEYDPCLQCHAVHLYIWWVSPRAEPRKLLELNEAAGSESLPLDRDVHLSADWSKVTIYRETSREPSEWELETLCRQAFEYKSCEKIDHSGPPPLPRVVVID